MTDETYEPAIGDEVVHKSNTKLAMVVIANDDSDSIECRWMDSKGSVQSEVFYAAELRPKPGLVGPIVA